MKLLSDSKFDIRQFYGNLVFLYPENHKELVNPLLERLDLSGHVYYCRAVGPSLLLKGDAFDEIVSLLDRCVCLVPVMNGELFEKEHTVSRSMFWYFIGYMRAKSQESVVPYLPADHPDLKGSPLQGIDIMFDADTFMEKIPVKFASKLLRCNYYENKTTNFYAARRIAFHCLSLHFLVYEGAFQNARNYYNECTGMNRSNSEFDSYLEKTLICGCRVVSFGTESKLEPQMTVYRDEVHPYVSDYPKALMGKRMYRRMSEEDRERTGIRAELMMDVLVPVHKLLGAYIKCYLTCPDPDCPVFMLLALMEPDFAEGRISEFDSDQFDDPLYWKEIYPDGLYIDTDTERMYFSLNFKRDEPPLPADEALHVGETLDYIFPQ